MEPVPLITPYWFKQRQCKAEELGPDFFRITGPNLAECFLGLRKLENGRYQGYFRLKQDGPDEAVTNEDFDTAYNAWEAMFELYRVKMIL
jgi:hypothetical protein